MPSRLAAGATSAFLGSSFRLLCFSTPVPHLIQLAHSPYLPTSFRPPLCTSNMTGDLTNDKLNKLNKTKENRKRTLLSKLPSQSRFGHSLTLRHVPRAPRACFFSRVLFFSHAYTHPRACFTHPRACFFSRIHIRWTCSRLLPWTGHWTLLPPGFAPHPSVRNITLASRLWDLVDGV